MADSIPSPLRELQRFEEDEKLARKMQQLYDDEREAHDTVDRFKIEDEFNTATRTQDEKRSEAMVRRIAPPLPAQHFQAGPANLRK